MVHSNRKDVVLMDTILNFPLPNESPTKLVEIAAFGKNDVTFLEEITFFLLSANRNRLHFP